MSHNYLMYVNISNKSPVIKKPCNEVSSPGTLKLFFVNVVGVFDDNYLTHSITI